MASPDVIVNGSDQCGDVALPVNPFVSNRYHFGMLLGVADLEAEQAYHRGKTWLHNAWLQGSGCVWGLEVQLEASRNEVVVKPGLAIDGHGRELKVSADMCVDITAWFKERRPDDLDITDNGDGTLSFTVHVELCHDSCLDRPVPSIAEPCEGGRQDTAYSRAVERGLPRIVAGPVPDDPPPIYPLVRQFLGHLPVVDEVVTAAIDEVNAAEPATRPAAALRAFRRLAAVDTMALGPQEGATGWSPLAGDGCVPLAQLAVHLRDDDGTLSLVVADDQASTVDNTVRPTLLRTSAIQEFPVHMPSSTTPE
ncbi:MAG: hypothetical protein OES24_02195 [Acidimicrobiia bacterium]|nr:hypothetical protein [Acidimicrobiia bacterium]